MVFAMKSIFSSVIPGYTPTQKEWFMMNSVASSPPATR